MWLTFRSYFLLSSLFFLFLQQTLSPSKFLLFPSWCLSPSLSPSNSSCLFARAVISFITRAGQENETKAAWIIDAANCKCSRSRSLSLSLFLSFSGKKCIIWRVRHCETLSSSSPYTETREFHLFYAPICLLLSETHAGEECLEFRETHWQAHRERERGVCTYGAWESWWR